MSSFYAGTRGMKDEGVPEGPLRQMQGWACVVAIRQGKILFFAGIISLNG